MFRSRHDRKSASLPSVEDDVVEQRALLDATLAFAQTQILAQVADEASLDGRTIGVLAFNGALLGGTVAAKGLLGAYWWTPFAPVGVATVPCLWSLFKKTSAFGPRALDFYNEFGALGPLPARTQLLSDLDDTFKFNERRVLGKVVRLRVALAVLVVGLMGSALLIATNRPNTIGRSCTQGQTRVQPQQGPLSPCLHRQGSRSSVLAASSATATASAASRGTAGGLVEVLVGVQLRSVGRQEVQLDPL